MARACRRDRCRLLGAGILAKAALFVDGGYEGFTACYRALNEEPKSGLCEKSYDNPLSRFDATRIDRQIDFAPTDWNLSFVNDIRFNYYPWEEGAIPRERIPFTVDWRGVISHDSPREIAVTYVGAPELWLGSTRLLLDPSYGRPRTVDLTVPGGRQGLIVQYTFDDESRVGMPGLAEDPVQVATLRIRLKGTGEDTPLRAEEAPTAWRALGAAVDGLALVWAIVLVWFHGRILAPHAPPLLMAGAAAWLVHGELVDFQILTADGTLVLSLLIPAAAIFSRSRGPAVLSVAWWGVALLVMAHEASLAESLHSVFVRRGGADFLTYESFAREILDTWSLQGGEDIFYYQPGFRYIRFLEHLLFGDGDVLVAAFSRTLLIVSVLWMAWTFRVRGAVSMFVSMASVVLLLVLLNSASIVTLLRNGLTEYPTWVAFPLFFTLFFRFQGGRPVLGSTLLAVALVTRINQAPGLLWLFAVRVWRAVRPREREMVLAAAVLTVLALIPAVHNLYYGGELVFTTASIGISENVVLRPSDYLAARHDEDARTRTRYQVGRILYGSSANERPPLGGGGLRPVFRGLELLWLFAVLTPFVSGSFRLVQRELSVRWRLYPLRGAGDIRHLMILLTPALFLAPHLFYQVDVYYPRHIVIGYMAVAASAMYATGVLRPYLQSARHNA